MGWACVQIDAQSNEFLNKVSKYQNIFKVSAKQINHDILDGYFWTNPFGILEMLFTRRFLHMLWHYETYF